MLKHKNDDIKLNTLLGRAIKKYGWDNFTTEIITECDDKEQLLELEQYYIQFFNSYKPNGYNMTMGGEKLYGEDNPFYNHKHSMQTRQKLSEYHKQRTKDKNPFYNHHHSEKTKQLISQANSKPICAIDDTGNIIYIFSNGIKARDWLLEQHLSIDKTANSTIIKAIKKHKKMYGYYWKYLIEDVETMDDECSPVG